MGAPMYKFKVESGDLKRKVTAINHTMAAMKALEKATGYLGSLTEVAKEGDEEKDYLYLNTLIVLNNMGIKTKYSTNKTN